MNPHRPALRPGHPGNGNRHGNLQSGPLHADPLPSSNDRAPPMLRRFACMMYEAVLLFGVLFLAGYLFDTLTQSRGGLVLRHTRQVWLFLAVGAYFILCWRASGQTLPMKTWRIKLVDAQGRPPPVPILAARYTLAWLLPLAAAAGVWLIARWSGYPATLMFIVAAPLSLFAGAWLVPDRQFLHDRMLGTRLVQAD